MPKPLSYQSLFFPQKFYRRLFHCVDHCRYPSFLFTCHETYYYFVFFSFLLSKPYSNAHPSILFFFSLMYIDWKFLLFLSFMVQHGPRILLCHFLSFIALVPTSQRHGFFDWFCFKFFYFLANIYRLEAPSFIYLFSLFTYFLFFLFIYNTKLVTFNFLCLSSFVPFLFSTFLSLRYFVSFLFFLPCTRSRPFLLFFFWSFPFSLFKPYMANSFPCFFCK